MGELYVDTEALTGLADQLRGLGDQALAARHYVDVNSTLVAGGEGWIQRLNGAHESATSYTMEWLRDLRHPLAVMSGGTIDRTIEHYLATDQYNAAQIDAQLPDNSSLLDVPEPAGDHFNLGHAWLGAFENVIDPEDRLQQITDYSNDERYAFRPGWYDLTSESSVGRTAIWEATGLMARLGWIDRAYDPYELATKWVVGDWAGYRRCADMYRNLALALTDASGNFHRSQVRLPEVWRGNAADSANVHVGRIRQALADTEGPLLALAQIYDDASEAQAEFRVVVGQVLGELIDLCVLLVILLGAVVFPPLAAATTVYVTNKIIRAINAIGRIWSTVESAMATIDGLLTGGAVPALGNTVLPRLPAVTGGFSTLDHLPSEFVLR